MKVIVLSGTPLAIPALYYFSESVLLSALICPQDSIASDVAPMEQWAAANGVPCWKVAEEHLCNDLSELVSETNPDLVLVYGFPYALPIPVMVKVGYGCWSVQFSLLDKWSGSITIHRIQDSRGKSETVHQAFSFPENGEEGNPLRRLSLFAVSLLRRAIAGARKEALIDRYFQLAADGNDLRPSQMR